MPQITEIPDEEEELEVTGPGSAMRQAQKQKDAGNTRFKCGDYNAACVMYTSAIETLDRWGQTSSKEAKETTIACLSNRAAAHLKMDRHVLVVADCTRVLDAQPSHAKAVFRRAQAYEALANSDQVGEREFKDFVGKALDDMQRLAVLEPTNKEAKKAVQRLKGMLQPASASTQPAGAADPPAAPLPAEAPQKVRHSTCELCRIGEGLLAARVVYQDALFVVLQEKAPMAAHHLLVAPKTHVPTADKLQHRHLAYVQHMQIVAHRLLLQQGADLTDTLLGFHLPPAAAGSHLYLHAISPASQIRRWDWYVKLSRTVFIAVDTVLQRLQPTKLPTAA